MPRFWIRPLLISAGTLSALVLITPAGAVLPLPPYPQCGTPNAPELCPNDLGEQWNFLSYIKDDYSDLVRDEELDLGSGMHLDRALALETGDFAITIAVLDSGIRWDEGNVLRKWRLNTKELPLPRRSDGTTSTTYDLTGDGLVNIDDYKQDSRVTMTAGDDAADSVLDPSDLIAVFSDKTDADHNGFIDDICGWDFMWNDNNPFDNIENQGYSHGTLEARGSASEGGDGGHIGTCPNCSVIMLRTGDSFMANSTSFAHAMAYAVDNNVKVVQAAVATLDNSALQQKAIDYAWANGVTFIASAADETSIHANLPGANNHAVVVHPNFFSGQEESDSDSFLNFNNCSDFGGRLVLSVPVNGCSSEATELGAGVAGLLYSAALHEGLTLSAGEVYQLLVGTADDIFVPEAYNTPQARDRYPSKPGWDRYFGYGRINAAAAVEKILDGQIPPEADLTGPTWFQVIDPIRTPNVTLSGFTGARSGSYNYVVEYGIGLDPTSWLPISSGVRTGALTGTLATWNAGAAAANLDITTPIEAFTLEDDNVSRTDKINRYTVTLRVRVIDSQGNPGESRKTVYLHHDPDLMDAFPLALGASLETSPKLYDFDGDGAQEIVQATADGKVYVFYGDGTLFPGFPVSVDRQAMLEPTNTANHLQGKAFTTGALPSDSRQLINAAPAVGDLDQDGDAEIVVATEEGKVYAWDKTGKKLAGFPVSLTPGRAAGPNTSEDTLWEDGFFGAPALGDLDGDGSLEIVAGAMDQLVYAWDWHGQTVAGWPVEVRWEGRSVTPTKRNRIMVTPAIGDVDGDGMNDVVIGTNEAIDFEWSPTYAIHGTGYNFPGSPFLRGWPIQTMGLYANLLPDIGAGTTASPALADLDGDGRLEVATHTVASVSSPTCGSIYDADGRIVTRLGMRDREFGGLSNVPDGAVIPMIGHGAFADLDLDGDIDYTMGTAGWDYLWNLLIPGKLINYTFSTTAWDAGTGDFLIGFPQQVADMQFFMNSAIADIGGSAMPEIISGTGAFTVHAFDAQGLQPEGWPKFTGQWIIATPTVGDIDGDGLLEVVVGTRSGFLYVWRTPGASPEEGGLVEWAGFHNDPANTGVYRGSADPGFSSPAQPRSTHLTRR